MFNSLGTVLDPKKSKVKNPEARVIVLDDNFNTFQLKNIGEILIYLNY